MERKALVPIFIMAISALTVAGTLLIQNGPEAFIVQAETSDNNPVIYGNTDAKITIQSPENKTYNENNVTLAFTIESDVPPVENFSGRATQLFLRHGVALDYDTANTNLHDLFPDDISVVLSNLGNRYFGNVTLTGLSQGPHNITVWIRADRYMISYTYGVWAVFSTVSFNIPPQITILSPETKAYNVSDLPLNFTVTESFSKIEYSLDGQSNVTINGNTTLTWLPNGYHNVTVYVTDEFGNTGVSKIIYFNVEAPFPTALVVAASVAAIAVVGVGLLVYFRKRKR